jgi:glycosyltransferase involved in cell wall biosynthesis
MSVVTIRSAAPPRADEAAPLRVCLVTEASGGGVGRHFLDLATGLTARGVDVACIYSPLRADRSFQNRLEQTIGPRFVPLSMRRAIHPLDAVATWRMTRLLRELGPFDVVHGHSSKGGALARLAARALGTAAVYTPHAFVTLDPLLPAWKRLLYGRLERYLARSSAAVIAVSEEEAAHARQLGIAAAKVHIVPNGIDCPALPPRALARSRLGLGEAEFAVGFAGRLTSQKAPDLLLAAFAKIAERWPLAHLVMIGGGPLEQVLREQVAVQGLDRRVHLLGETEAVSVMPALDLFCLSSRYEGMPYVLLEALAAGLPIVATRVGGVRSCVTHDVNGLLVEPGDSGELAQALSRLAGDAALRRRLARASGALAQRFTAEQMVEQTLQVYAYVVRDRRGAPPGRAHLAPSLRP